MLFRRTNLNEVLTWVVIAIGSVVLLYLTKPVGF